MQELARITGKRKAQARGDNRREDSHAIRHLSKRTVHSYHERATEADGVDRKNGQVGVGTVNQTGDDQDPKEWAHKWKQGRNPHDPDNDREFWDELSGKRLDGQKVRKA